MTTINLNGQRVTVESPDDTPLLWVLREDLKLTGTKYSCGMGLCGSCTVLVSGHAVRSCITPVGSLNDKPVQTIEGLSAHQDKTKLHPVQEAWKDINVAQCGYCQSGQIMAAVALLNGDKNPGRESIRQQMAGNLCRCGTYPRIEKAILQAAKSMRDSEKHHEQN